MAAGSFMAGFNYGTSSGTDSNRKKSNDELTEKGYLPAADGYVLQKYGPNDVVITFDCCPAPVLVGILTEEDRRVGYKQLPAAEFLPCPAKCGSLYYGVERRPKDVIFPAAKSKFKPKLFWYRTPASDMIKVHIILDSYHLTVSDIQPNENSTYPITELDIEHIPLNALLLGWRVCPKIEGESTISDGSMRILKKDPTFTGIPFEARVDPRTCPFKLSQEEKDAGWHIVEYKRCGHVKPKK